MKPEDVKRAAILLEAREKISDIFDALDPDNVVDATRMAIVVGPRNDHGMVHEAALHIDSDTGRAVMECVSGRIENELKKLGIDDDE